MPGDDCSSRVCLTISRPVRAHVAASTDLTRSPAIQDMVTAPEYRHVPTGTLAVLAQRLGKVWASPSTWYHLVQKFGWRRPRLRVHPAKPKVGPRTTRADEMWHIDTTVIRLLDGTRAYLHAVIDNFSRRILAWRVADVCAGKQRGLLLEASRGATPSETIPVVLADTGGRQTRNMTGGTGPTHPGASAIPTEYRHLLEWYTGEYANSA
jgi:hypothetical protein